MTTPPPAPTGLRPVHDGAAAAWLAEREQPWPRLALFGPAGYEAYARLRFIPDPAWFGQEENDHNGGNGLDGELEQLRTVVEVLRRHTRTPDQAWHCLWDGWGVLQVGATALLGEPTVHHPGRDYHLFTGPLADLGNWGADDVAPGVPQTAMPPAFVWPEDRAWCIAADVDPHWAGIGGSRAAVNELVALSTVDVVHTDPSEQQPSYG